jgi:hypothetical protein
LVTTDDLAGPDQGVIEGLGVDDVEPGDVLFGLDKGAVGHDRVASAETDDGRAVGAVKGATEDERSAGVHLRFEGNNPPMKVCMSSGVIGAPETSPSTA